jgi:hypothetical protein
MGPDPHAGRDAGRLVQFIQFVAMGDPGLVTIASVRMVGRWSRLAANSRTGGLAAGLCQAADLIEGGGDALFQAQVAGQAEDMIDRVDFAT